MTKLTQTTSEEQTPHDRVVIYRRVSSPIAIDHRREPGENQRGSLDEPTRKKE
jgi:hypothetical protein